MNILTNYGYTIYLYVIYQEKNTIACYLLLGWHEQITIKMQVMCVHMYMQQWLNYYLAKIHDKEVTKFSLL